MSAFSIVKRKFTADEFAAYMATVPIGQWTTRVVLHNTGAPSLAQRPGGILTPKHIDILLDYYQFRAPVKKKPTGWSGGPHLFIDVEGIWVFNPLDRKGVHSPSFNSNGWGVEMLGDYSVESFTSGLGLKVHKNAVAAVAAMIKRLGGKVTADNFKIHKDDPLTDHNCPGKNVSKTDFIAEVKAAIGGLPEPQDEIKTKIVVYRKGAGPDPVAVVNGVIRDGQTLADAGKLSAATGISTTKTGEAAVREFVGAKYLVSFDATTGKVYLAEK